MASYRASSRPGAASARALTASCCPSCPGGGRLRRLQGRVLQALDLGQRVGEVLLCGLATARGLRYSKTFK